VHILVKPDAPPVAILDVEQMPFPQPFGGKRDALLKKYDITYKGKVQLEPWPRPGMKPEDAKPPAKALEHLVLVPKPGSKGEHTRVEFWIDPDTGLMEQVRTEDRSERIMTVRFVDAKRNEAAKDVDDKAFEPGPLPDDWRKTVNDLTEKAEP
jgi:outer membrane lipoprotein-sorting protein